MRVLKQTKSLCPECLKVLDGILFEEDNTVYIKKECPEHGFFQDVYWSDYGQYERAKTFEYIGAQKPVFVISTSRYTNELLAGYEPAHLVDSFEPEKIYRNLKEFLQKKKHLNSFDSRFINRFNRVQQTKKIAEILNTISRK